MTACGGSNATSPDAVHGMSGSTSGGAGIDPVKPKQPDELADPELPDAELPDPELPDAALETRASPAATT